MTANETPAIPFLDRAPIVGDIITITPKGVRLFDVIALDDLYNEFIYARPHNPADDSPAQWHSLAYVKVVDDEDPRAWEG